MAKIIYKVYGDALFSYAEENKIIEKTYEEANDIYNVLCSSLELENFLYSPNITKEDKKKTIKELFLNKFWNNNKTLSIFNVEVEKGKNSKIFNFIDIIIDKGREIELKNIFNYFLSKVRDSRNIGLAYVTSAFELSKDQKERLENKLIDTTEYKQFIINYNVDETIISGIKIQIGDRLVDSSLKSKINEISKNLRGAKV